MMADDETGSHRKERILVIEVKQDTGGGVTGRRATFSVYANPQGATLHLQRQWCFRELVEALKDEGGPLGPHDVEVSEE